jgi:hypothetical protein
MVIAGWSYRNFERRGVWTFSTVGALDTYYYRAAGVLAYENGQSFDDVQSGLLQSTGNSVEALSPAVTEELGRRGRAILLRHPGALCIVTLRGFLRTCFWVERSGVRILFGYDAPPNEGKLGVAQKISSTLSFPLLSFALFAEFALLAFTWTGVGLALWCLKDSQRRQTLLIIIPLCAAVLLLAAAAGPEGYDRFRVPVIPMLAMVAASGWTGRCRLMMINEMTHTHV